MTTHVIRATENPSGDVWFILLKSDGSAGLVMGKHNATTMTFLEAWLVMRIGKQEGPMRFFQDQYDIGIEPS